MICCLIAGPGAVAATAAQPGKPPNLDARAWIAIDARTGESLAAARADQRLPMASTTKLMTAYLALRSLPMNRKVTAGDYDATAGESLMDLKEGQVVSVRDLLYGLILLSGNDAAVTLAEAVSGNVPRFVDLMNSTAVKLGMTDTHYENPIGLDGKRHFTSARDLASLSRTLMSLPRFRRIAAARAAKLRSYRPPVEIETINQFLLDNSWALGIKTGHTNRSRYVLASDGRRRAVELIGAVIGAPTEAARDGETVELLDYGFSLYSKRVPVRPGRPAAAVPVRYEDEDLALGSRRPVRIGLRKGERLRVRTTTPDEVEGPIRKGQRLGRAVVSVDGERIAAVPLFASRAVAEPGLIDKLRENPLPVALALIFFVCAILGLVVWISKRRESRMRRRLQRVTRRTK